jgi:hypothetical protein
MEAKNIVTAEKCNNASKRIKSPEWGDTISDKEQPKMEFDTMNLLNNSALRSDEKNSVDLF